MSTVSADTIDHPPAGAGAPFQKGQTLLRRALVPLMGGLATAGPRNRRFDPDARLLGRIGPLVVRLARSAAELRAAQALRYAVFFEEMSARPSPIQRLTKRDSDPFDRFCDHLLVIDETLPGPDAERIVGTYRLHGPEAAAKARRYYSEDEFDLAPMLRRHADRRFLELGRSCVLKPYRSKRTVELLWQGIWAYVVANRIDAMFGCASLEGVDPAALAEPLAFLREHAPPPAEWQVSARSGRAVRLPPNAACSDPRRAMTTLPPLLKGYLRLGGFISPEPVIDARFGTTDVLVVLLRERINPRYVGHYGESADRFAA
ncbi:GNAT family N-acetyltransferase [Antarcticirhabdus aurantiaca]|uniref:GNAT family N-acetyltransferase n=1 Tax=Antarcticirhabdus aurantiaca TaxID=2606717 RepID=A0ACD4NQJ2_9HYPH|nr:GNAT family N-acyltransferase [Antarcticirhabdus aurantiaca]WAJ29037.1 GNAT family N-acetyltransferase [Jeongeuplla avenae]